MNDTQFLLLAAKYYDNEFCLSLEDFYSDVSCFTTVKKLFTKYYATRSTNERLIINYLIGLYNVFDANFVNRVLFHRVAKEHRSLLKTFLNYMQRCPDVIYDLDGNLIDVENISEDKLLYNKLESM